ncbi:hypothetical protein FOB64_003139 [Candida albicans]|uniref:Uncharacterized protein n=1 Tax=Candida albicans TaxID=5476 RepID=A0A8H6F3Q8_CANAX|nr:hypothetical protein FOB64_003139 [Candida albicans]
MAVIRNFNTTSTASTTTSLSETETEDEDEPGFSSCEDEEDEEIKPIVVTTTKDKVHSKLLPIEIMTTITTIITIMMIIMIMMLIYLIVLKKITFRLARRKSRKSGISPPSPPKLNFTATNMSNSSSSLSSTTTATATATASPLMKQYLTDQNNKFDRLITKNLDIVLNGDITKDPNEKILQLIYENRSSIFNYVYKTGKNQLSTRLPYIPYFNPKSTSSTKNYHDNEEAFSDSDSSATFNEIEELISLLDNNEQKIDYFINSLNDNTKQLLKRRLEKDFHGKGEAIKNLIIISCRISFKIMKKIQDIFNHKNMDTLIEYVLKIMVYVDSKLDEENKKT